MANSKLLKEAIADAKAVRETAIANAKIALEEAFTPRLQSILSKKLQAEMEGEEEEIEEELDSSDIGSGDEDTPVEPSDVASDAHTELGPETEEETAEVGDELEEEVVSEEEHSDEEAIEEGDGHDDEIEEATISEEEEVEETVSEEEEVEEGYHEGDDEDSMDEEEEVEEGYHEEEEIEEEDELDLEAIIKELEMDMEEDEVEEGYHEEEEVEETVSELEMSDDEEIKEDEEESEESEEEADEEEAEEEDDMDDEIDLDEILREMGYGEGEEEIEEEEHEEEANEEVVRLQTELEEALSTVKTLQSTINEVNLLNAKLLYANRLFRAYNLNNEQKSKVVENLDRTTSVREVKLVYATLAESMNFTGTERKTKKVVAEAASKPVASTAPAKEIISENTNTLAERFKQLANIK